MFDFERQEAGVIHQVSKDEHNETAEPYIVPFKSDHRRHVFNNIIDVALTRTIRYSSTLADFDGERRFIKFILLYNGYALVLLLLPVSFYSLFIP